MPTLTNPKTLKPKDFAFLIFADLNQQFASVGMKRLGFSITEGAITAFNKHGLQAVTLGQVSKACGVQSATIVYHFGSLQKLKIQTMKYCRILYQSFVIRKMMSGSSASEQFDQYLLACVEWPKIFKKHSQFWIQALSVSVSDDRVRQTNTESVVGGRARLINFIQVGVDQKMFTCADSTAAGHAIHLLVTGYVLAAMTQDDCTEFSELRRQCRSLLRVMNEGTSAPI